MLCRGNTAWERLQAAFVPARSGGRRRSICGPRRNFTHHSSTLLMTMSLGSRSRPSSAHAHAPTHSGTPHALLLSEATYIHGLMPHIHACALTVIGHKQRARRAHHAAPCAPAWPSKRSSTDSCMVICCHTYMQLHTWIVICRIYACGCKHGLSPHMPHIHAAAYMDCRPMFPSLCRG